MKKQDAGMNLRSHPLDKLRQIITTHDRRTTAVLVLYCTYVR
eukprot:SAG25_NODE_371_length_9000_cov_6.528480_11_plen_42_part_00